MHILTCEELIDILAQKAREALDAGGEHSNYGVVRSDDVSSLYERLKMISGYLKEEVG